MSFWNPKPLRPTTANPLFEMEAEETYVVKSQSAIEAQRERDGSPHTSMRPSALGPPPAQELYLSSDKLDKAQHAAPVPTLDPDLVVKSYMALPDKEDEEKSVGDAVAKVGTAAVGAAGKTALGAVKMAASAK